MTKRQSLKLLGELLLDRTNFAIMTRYIACVDNLKMVMVLLRDRSSSIQLGQHGAKRPPPPPLPPGGARARHLRLLRARLAALDGSDAPRVQGSARLPAHPPPRVLAPAA